MKAYTDPSYASDPGKWPSITGFLIYFCGALVSWKSKLQRSQTLSLTKAKYIEIMDVVKKYFEPNLSYYIFLYLFILIFI